MFCRECGNKLSENALKCPKCDTRTLPTASPSIGNDPGIRMLLPVGRSGWAVAAGYLGLFSVIPFFAPFAILTGILAILDIKKHPDKHGMGRAVFGLAMGIVGCILLALIVLIGIK